ncbi:hypothetical protein GCM10023346_05400 [Arthrobacter gyeryongensis]|uniref:Uncharacterized protein n=1 Tax=Arthrobacter gyeryongensis TaxID=1650592 RepID=A0ABP9S2T1_9MICC
MLRAECIDGCYRLVGGGTTGSWWSGGSVTKIKSGIEFFVISVEYPWAGIISRITNETKPAKKTVTIPTCPVCANEAYPIAFGTILPDVRESMPKTEFEGCCIDEEIRIYPTTGKVEQVRPNGPARTPSAASVVVRTATG